MASIHRKPKSKFFHAAWRDASGKLHLRSTKQTERGPAMAVALEYERAERMGASGTLTEEQARSVLSDIMKRAGTEEGVRCPSTSDYISEWLSSKEASKSDGTASRYRTITTAFLSHLGPWAKRPLAAITSQHIESFIAARRRAGLSASTVNLTAKVIGTAFNKARRMGIINSNPVEAVELESNNPMERGVFSAEEVNVMLAAAKGEWRTLIMIGAFTGQRITDCATMAWADVDLTAGTWTMRQGKTKAKVVMPMHPDLLVHLETLAGVDAPAKHVMPELANTSACGRNGLSETFIRFMRSAGVDSQPVTRKDGQRTVSRRSFHSLRHSFNSALANADVSQEVRMRLTGHQSKQINTGYTHHELAALKSAVGKLPGITKG